MDNASQIVKGVSKTDNDHPEHSLRVVINLPSLEDGGYRVNLEFDNSGNVTGFTIKPLVKDMASS